MTTLEKEWLRYRNVVYGSGPLNPTQEKETRQAFFAGCLVLCAELAEALLNGGSINASIARVSELYDEAIAHGRQRVDELKRDEARRN